MRLSPEERQRRSNHMKAILANRKALKGMLAQPDGEPAKWIDKGNGRIIDTSAKVDVFPVHPDGAVLAKTSMFDVARYYLLKRLLAKRKASNGL